MEQEKENFFKRKVVTPLINLLKEGVTPHKLALSIAIGGAIGVFPIFGTSTALCVLLAGAFKLNQVAIQVANYAVYPFQLALIIPFIQIGIYFLGMDATELTATELAEQFSADWLGAFQKLWKLLLGAVLAWAIVMTPLCILTYFLSKPAFKKIVEKLNHTAKE